jgi:hypothetical protein
MHFGSALRYRRPACGHVDPSTPMSGVDDERNLGRLLAAGQRAEVFEWGSRVVKLCAGWSPSMASA